MLSFGQPPGVGTRRSIPICRPVLHILRVPGRTCNFRRQKNGTHLSLSYLRRRTADRASAATGMPPIARSASSRVHSREDPHGPAAHGERRAAPPCCHFRSKGGEVSIPHAGTRTQRWRMDGRPASRRRSGARAMRLPGNAVSPRQRHGTLPAPKHREGLPPCVGLPTARSPSGQAQRSSSAPAGQRILAQGRAARRYPGSVPPSARNPAGVASGTTDRTDRTDRTDGKRTPRRRGEVPSGNVRARARSDAEGGTPAGSGWRWRLAEPGRNSPGSAGRLQGRIQAL